jgi:hypothetical protein
LEFLTPQMVAATSIGSAVFPMFLSCVRWGCAAEIDYNPRAAANMDALHDSAVFNSQPDKGVTL